MATYNNLSEMGGPLNGDYGIPWANTIANQQMSMINPVDRALINREATLRGQEMSKEALKQQQFSNNYQDLLNRQLGAQEVKWSPEAILAAETAKSGLKELPLKTEYNLQDLMYQNTPEYRALRNQLLGQQPKSEFTKLQGQDIENAPYAGAPVNVSYGGKQFTMTPATQKEYQDIMLKLLGYESEKYRAALGLGRETDQEKYVQRNWKSIYDAAQKDGKPISPDRAKAMAAETYRVNEGAITTRGAETRETETQKTIDRIKADPVKAAILKQTNPELYSQIFGNTPTAQIPVAPQGRQQQGWSVQSVK